MKRLLARIRAALAPAPLREPDPSQPAGRVADALELQRGVRLALGTLPYFRPLLRPAATALGTGLLLLPLGLYLAWTLSSVFWNGLLSARPLEGNQAALFWLDRGEFVRPAIELSRGIEPDMLDALITEAGYAPGEVVLGNGYLLQQQRDAVQDKLTSALSLMLPQVLPAEITWAPLRRAVLVPRLSDAMRIELALRGGLYALGALVLAAAAFALLRARRGWLLAGACAALLLLLPARLCQQALWTGALRGEPIGPISARLLFAAPERTVSDELARARGFHDGLLEEAAAEAALPPDALEATPEDPQWPDRRAVLLQQLAALQPELLPVDFEWADSNLSKPVLNPLLSVDARRALRTRIVVFSAFGTLVLLPLGIALLLYAIRLLQRVNQTLRVQLLTRMQALSLRYHADAHVGDSIYRLYQDSSTVLQLLGSVVLRPLFAVLGPSGLLVGLVVISAFSPGLTLGLCLTACPMLWLTRRWSPVLRQAFRNARERNAELTSRVQEALSSIQVIKAYGAEAYEQERFEQASQEAFSAAQSARLRLAGFDVAMFWMTGLALVAADAVLALRASTQSATFLGAVLGVVGFALWNLGAFRSARARLSMSTGGLQSVLGSWIWGQDQIVGMTRVLEQLALEPEVQNAPGAVPLRSVEESVVFKGVTFGYRPEQPVLREIELEARPGTITAIMGPTGSGKTTLLALLLRLYDPQEGSIQIDGRDLRGYDLDSVRDRIGIALQQNLLFGTTVRENIRYAMPAADDGRVLEAARVACADEFIAQLPGDLDTALGERGAKLSTGQRQRLAIARAIIKDPRILVLDEPTAALDAETELRVLERLAQWGQGRVIFLVTHRLSALRRADRIVYLRDGLIVESGSPAELMERPGGLYRRLVQLEILTSRSEPNAQRAGGLR